MAHHRRPLTRQLTFILLGLILTSAALLGGAWRLEHITVVAVLAGFGWVYVFFVEDAASFRVPVFALVFLGAAVWTAFQALPLGSMLATLSARAAEVRAFTTGTPHGPITYESSATWKEAGRLVVYAQVAGLAYIVGKKKPKRILQTVVFAAAVSVVVGLGHVVFNIPTLLGHIEGQRATQTLRTTFLNPNHSAGFCNLAALSALGAALGAKRLDVRWGGLIAAGIFGAISISETSKGGLIALFVGLGLFGGLVFLRARKSVASTSLFTLLAVFFAPIIGFVTQLDRLTQELAIESSNAWGLAEKWAAVKDAAVITKDHQWLGIGRGAFVSVYPSYQSSPLQLTFVFPENMLAQWTTEWGVVVGTASFIAVWGVVIIRLAREKSPAQLGALSGVFAVVLQNLVDFSLELPGVALPVIAIVIVTGHSRAWRPATRPIRALVGLGPPLLAAGLFALAWQAGDLGHDLKALEAYGNKARTGQTVNIADAERRAARHPANVIAATRMAYIYETKQPPDLRNALRAANRALYLGPQYADIHVVVARLLLTAGHRRQAFESLRSALTLGPGRPDILETTVRTAKTPAELAIAIPRRDAALGIVDEKAWGRIVSAAIRIHSREWAAPMRAILPPVASIPEKNLLGLVKVALALQDNQLAEDAARRAETISQDASLAQLALARVLRAQGRLREALELTLEISEDGTVGQKELFDIRWRLAVESEAFETGTDIIKAMKRQLGADRDTQVWIAKREAELWLRAKRPDKALKGLDLMLYWNPGDTQTRLRRAQTHLALGHKAEAQADIDRILRRHPDHRGAQALRRRILKKPSK